jgi:hypothetical protein
VECLEVQHDRILCSCPWLDQAIEVVWLLSWWPDGNVQEDDRVVVKYAGAAKVEIDVRALLRERHDRPLRAIIIEHITHACSKIIDTLKDG